MQRNSDNPVSHETDIVRLCLLPEVDYSDLALLLNALYHSGNYRVCLDVSALSRLGTVEFRVLGSFAEALKQRGGFLRLERASAQITTVVQVFGFNELLSSTS
jgi:anti-anti-sigma regulatory factor